MSDQDKTSAQLAQELAGLRLRVAELQDAVVERARAEERLRESESRYRRVIE